LLGDYEIENIFFGIGLPFHNHYLTKVVENTKFVDFVVFVLEDKQIEIGYEIVRIF
jgi:hypothetical protein